MDTFWISIHFEGWFNNIQATKNSKVDSFTLKMIETFQKEGSKVAEKIIPGNLYKLLKLAEELFPSVLIVYRSAL